MGVGGCAKGDLGVTGGRLRLLLGSACVAALLLGSGTPPALAAACAINDVANSAGAGPFNNTTNSINCINIQNSTVNGGTGNVSNTAPGVIATTAASQSTGIRINNSTLTGSVINTGTITATVGNGDGIVIVSGASVAGGITNTGAITAKANGIVDGVEGFGLTFSAGITNSGTIVATTGAGIAAAGISTFTGGITNSGTVSAQIGFNIADISTFSGGIFNSGTVAGAAPTAGSPVGIAVDGTGHLVGASPATFTGGITNTGLVSGGIGVADFATFTGGNVSNQGTITGTKNGIVVTASTTFAGAVTNSGTISVANVGILVGAFTFIGLTISGGVSSFVGNIVNSGTITAKTGISVASSTIQGAIIVSGNLLATSHGIDIDSASKITSAATAVAISAPTFLNGIRNQGTISGVNAGIMVAGGSTFTGGIGNGGTILSGVDGILVQSVPFFSGNISNAGTVSAAAGIVIGAGVTFHGGAAIVNSGNITGSVAAIDVSAATSPVTINQTAGTIAGAIKLSTNADVLNVSGGVINGNIVGAGVTNTVNFALGSGTFTYDNSFTGINQVNVNSGTVILNGANSATRVDVNGGTLAGAGSIDPVAVTIHAGGTFAPGTPGTPGTSMSIVGTLTFQPGATYQVYLNPSSATSATVSGAVSLAGTVQANFASGTYVSRSYDILHSGGLGGTTFSGLTTIPPNFNAALSYTSTDVLLNVTAGLGQNSSLTVNQQNVATALNTFFNNGGALPPGFAAVFGLGGASLANALNQLDGEVATGAQRAAFQIESEFLSLLIDPFVYGRGDAFAGAYGGMLGFAPQEEPTSLPQPVALAYASVLKAPPQPLRFEPRWTAWGSVYGGQASAKGDPNIVGSTNVTTGTFGFAGGMDYRLSPDTVVGFGLGAGGTGWGLAQGMGSGRSDTLQAGVYGATHRGPAYAAAAVAFAESWMTTNRTALGDALTADFTGQSVGARFEAGYRLPVMLAAAALGVAPYAAVQTQWFHTPTYSERDLVPAGFGLTYQAMTANDTRSELGVRVDELTAVNGMPLLLRGRLAWAHDWISNPALTAVFQTLPGTNFVVFGAPVAHDTALVSAGAELRITPKLGLIAKFDGEFAAGSQTYAGSGTLRYRW